MQTEHSTFPPDETLAAYIDGRLDEETRKRVVEHMAECPECFDVVMGGREAAIAAEPRGRVLAWPRKAVISLAAAAVLAMAVFLTPIRERIWPRDDIRALAAAAPPERLSDGRITGFPYRPRARTMRGGDDVTKNPEYWKFWEVAARVADAAKKHPDAQTLHTEGVSQLVIGNSPEAVAELEKALLQASREPDLQKAIATSTDVELLSDLAAALIAAGKVANQTTTYRLALLAANRAWEIKHTPEIAWNRAVAAELLDDRDAAIENWRQYLALDSKSKWALDASDSLKRLRGFDE